MPCVGNGVKGRPVVPVLARAVAATQGGSQVQQIFRVGEPHPLPVPCQELCPKVLAVAKEGGRRAIGKRRGRGLFLLAFFLPLDKMIRSV